MKDLIYRLLPDFLKKPALAIAAFLRDPKYTWLYARRFHGLSTNNIRYLLERQYQCAFGQKPNLDNPQTFNEKLQWYKLYYKNRLLTQCADKVCVRDYIGNVAGSDILIPTIGVYNSADDINIDMLPNRFVAKVNWGSGQNIICKNKATLDVGLFNKQLSKWMRYKSNHYYDFFEWCYKYIRPKIIIESYIEQMDNYLIDYKIHTFSGKPKLLQFIDRWETHKEVIYDVDTWEKTGLHFTYELLDRDFDKSPAIIEMLKLCEKIAASFPYARVDFYNIAGKVYFGELTFYPGNGMLAMTEEWANTLGAMFKLPLGNKSA